MNEQDVAELKELLVGTRSRAKALETGLELLQNEDTTSQQREWIIDMLFRSVDDVNYRLTGIALFIDTCVDLRFSERTG